MKPESRIYVAGHTGLVGSAILRRLKKDGYANLVTRRHGELDLVRATDVMEFFERERPGYVFLAAARVGGIHANNSFPADFLRINLQIQTNVIEAAFTTGVKKLLLLGSSCIYPRNATQPMKEEYLLDGKLEPTNDAYAIAKIAGIFMCKSYNRQHGTNFIAAMPPNLYGPGDNFDPMTSHALPAMLAKFHRARLGDRASVELWGTGTPRREFLYVDDVAEALLFLMKRFDADPDHPDHMFLNVGAGSDLTIRELAERVKRVVGYSGEVVWNPSMPDGVPQKLLDTSRLAALGWRPSTSLEQGLQATYAAFCERQDQPKDGEGS